MSKYITDKRYFMILLLLVLLVIFAFTVISGSILPASTPQFTPTITPTPTDLPENFPNVIRDYFENQNGTNGLLAGSVVLVLIILLGVLISIRNNEK